MFWQDVDLDDLDREQWESLCDGCGKCCLHKLHDEETGAYVYTAVACRLLDLEQCRCEDYPHRLERVDYCLDLYNLYHSGNTEAFRWLPTSCAYRLRAGGEPLPSWHHLVCGDRDAVHSSGHSVRDKVVSGEHVHPDDADAMVIHWVEC